MPWATEWNVPAVIRPGESEPGQPAPELARRLAGERQDERVRLVGGARRDAVGDAPGEHSRLARAGAGDHRDQL